MSQKDSEDHDIIDLTSEGEIKQITQLTTSNSENGENLVNDTNINDTLTPSNNQEHTNLTSNTHTHNINHKIDINDVEDDDDIAIIGEDFVSLVNNNNRKRRLNFHQSSPVVVEDLLQDNDDDNESTYVHKNNNEVQEIEEDVMITSVKRGHHQIPRKSLSNSNTDLRALSWSAMRTLSSSVPFASSSNSSSHLSDTPENSILRSLFGWTTRFHGEYPSMDDAERQLRLRQKQINRQQLAMEIMRENRDKALKALRESEHDNHQQNSALSTSLFPSNHINDVDDAGNVSDQNNINDFMMETGESSSSLSSSSLAEKRVMIKCTICFQEPDDSTEFCSTLCGHVFCRDCIEESLKKDKRCPMCRKSLKGKKSYHTLFL